MAQYFSSPPHASAAAPDPPSAAAHRARRRRHRLSDRLELCARLPARRRRRGPAHPRDCAASTSGITSRSCAATSPTSAASRDWTTGSSASLRQGVPGSFTFLLPATREVPRRLQHARAQHDRRSRARPSGGARAARRARRAAPVVDADPARRRAAAERCRGDPRSPRARSVDLILDAGACPIEPTTVVDLAVDPPAVVRLGPRRSRPARARGPRLTASTGSAAPATG